MEDDLKGIGEINKNIMDNNIIEIVGASQNMEFALYAWGSSFRTLNSRNLIGRTCEKDPILFYHLQTLMLTRVTCMFIVFIEKYPLVLVFVV